MTGPAPTETATSSATATHCDRSKSSCNNNTLRQVQAQLQRQHSKNYVIGLVIMQSQLIFIPNVHILHILYNKNTMLRNLCVFSNSPLSPFPARGISLVVGLQHNITNHIRMPNTQESSDSKNLTKTGIE